MKELTIKWVRGFMVFVLATTLISTSCKKDDDNDTVQSYEGKWTSNENIFSDEFDGEYKDIMTLTKNTFEDRIQTPSGEVDDKWEDSVVLKGTMTVSGNLIDVHISDIGISVDPFTGENTGSITYYKEGSLIFETIIAGSGQDKDFELEYSISNDKMTLKSDRNGDGDKNDENESAEYTRL